MSFLNLILQNSHMNTHLGTGRWPLPFSRPQESEIQCCVLNIKTLSHPKDTTVGSKGTSPDLTIETKPDFSPQVKQVLAEADGQAKQSTINRKSWQPCPELFHTQPAPPTSAGTPTQVVSAATATMPATPACAPLEVAPTYSCPNLVSLQVLDTAIRKRQPCLSKPKSHNMSDDDQNSIPTQGE